MTGHIKLGKLIDDDVDLHDYVLVDVSRYQAATANPFIARVNTGGKYNEQDTFSDWTIQDWHSGVGNEDPEQGPLFSLAETRFPGYLMLPLAFEYPLTQRYYSNGEKGGTEMSLLSPRMYSLSWTAPKTGNVTKIWVNAYCPEGKIITCELRADGTSNAPGTVLKTATNNSLQERVHRHQMLFEFSTVQAVTAGTRYHVTIKSDMATLLDGGVGPYFCTAIRTGEYGNYSDNGGTTWSQNPIISALGMGFDMLVAYESNDETINGIFLNGSNVYVWHGNTLSKVVAGDLVTKVTETNIYDVKQTGTILYIACGSSYHVYDLADDSDSEVVLTAYLFLLHGGFLWRSTGTSVAYTADEVTWVVLDSFTDGTGNQITGLAGLDQNLYAATAQGMYMIAPGDVAVQAAPWPEPDANNGRGMVTWEGALYVPLVGAAIMRFDSSGAMLNVGVNAKQELPRDLRGRVVHLYPSTYFLYASVANGASLGHSSLWSFNGDGWHCIALGPQKVNAGALTIDRNNNYLYWGLGRNLLMRATHLATINNPARDQVSFLSHREGWIEYERFYAGTNTLPKDFDRVFVDVENSSPYSVVLFWQDENNNVEYATALTQYGWMLLGATEDVSGVIQFPPDARPGGRWMRLGARLRVGADRPVVRGLSVKYSTTLTDRWRWVLPILISDDQQMADGTINQFSADEQKTHLETMIAEVPPLRFIDLDGTERTVKVTGASSGLARYEWESSRVPPGPAIQWVYTLQLEEV